MRHPPLAVTTLLVSMFVAQPLNHFMRQMSDFPFDLVMFDLDGTLLETAPELADAVNDTLAGLGLAPVSLSSVRNWIGNGVRELLVQALASTSGQVADAIRGSRQLEQAVRDFEPLYATRCGSNSWPYPQADVLLRQWHALGIALAVITNKDSHFTGLLLKHHGLSPWFHRVIAGDTLARKKPAPDGILDCLAQFDVAPARALFVGDSSIDVATARNAGVRVWARAEGYNLGQPIANSRPDRVFTDYAELLRD